MASSYFITSTGTGIGKTFVTCLLAHQLRSQGYHVRAIKPVISGWQYEEGADNEENDTVNILKALALPVTAETIQAVSPWRFTAPLSPDMAASREGKSVSFEEVVAFCAPQLGYERQIIEGAGGVMTPVSENKTMRDLIEALAVQAVLVTGSYLGSLSHSLTAIEALAARSIPLACVIVSESEASTVPLKDTVETLRRFTKVPIIFLPREHHAGSCTGDYTDTALPALWELFA